MAFMGVESGCAGAFRVLNGSRYVVCSGLDYGWGCDGRRLLEFELDRRWFGGLVVRVGWIGFVSF